MRKLTRVLLLSGLAACTTLSSAWASEPAGSWYFTPMVHAVFADDRRAVDDDFGFTIAAGKAVSEAWNLELSLQRAEFEGPANNDLTTNTLGVNALRVFYRDARIAPFMLIGAGWSEANYDFAEDQRDGYAEIGAGILAKLAQSSSSTLSLRADVRGRHTFVDSSRLVDYLAGVGFQYAFGGRAAPAAAEPEPAAPAAPVDSDGDGVTDDRDRCPNTPAGTAVDANGCELDSDADGVVDSRDKCPGTPAGMKVDAVGCELDTDGDGVLDSKDRCPDTPKGDKVDAVGCSLTLRLEVFFELNSDQLTADSRTTLDSVAARLNELTNISGVIEGHTDSSGSDAYNQALSERRARTVRTYLVSKGVAASRLQSAGFGESKPIADNTSDAGRAQNRRVVLRRTDNAQ